METEPLLWTFSGSLMAVTIVTVRQAVDEFLAVVRQYLLDANRAGQGKVFQEGLGAPGDLVFPYFQEHPADRPVDGDKQITLLVSSAIRGRYFTSMRGKSGSYALEAFRGALASFGGRSRGFPSAT
jgi:hypothetical protein